MKLQDRYQWQATKPDGAVIESGGDLSGAALVTITPDTPLFPTHRFAGLPFLRRFCRGFLRGMGGGMREYVHCIVCQTCRIYVFSTTGAVLVTPPDYEFYL